VRFFVAPLQCVFIPTLSAGVLALKSTDSAIIQLFCIKALAIGPKRKQRLPKRIKKGANWFWY
jgi:hypothetical protein